MERPPEDCNCVAAMTPATLWIVSVLPSTAVKAACKKKAAKHGGNHSMLSHNYFDKIAPPHWYGRATGHIRLRRKSRTMRSSSTCSPNGRQTPRRARLSWCNLCGICTRMPAPSPMRGSAPTAPRCSRLSKMVRPSSIILCDLRPLRSAMKPTQMQLADQSSVQMWFNHE